MNIERHEARVPDQLADELVGFCENLYETSYEAS